MIVNTQEKSINYDSEHNQILKSLGLYNSEALQSEAVDWFNWNNLGICMHKKSLNLYPFFLFITKIITTLSLLDLLIELVYDNRNKQVHNEESRYENVNNIK